MKIYTQRTPVLIGIEQVRLLIADEVRRYLESDMLASDRQGVKNDAVKVLRKHRFTIDNANRVFRDAVKEYRKTINPEFAYHVFNLYFVALDGSVWVKNYAHTGYTNISDEPITEARRTAFVQYEQFKAGTRRYVTGEHKARQFMCVNCDHVANIVTNHNAPIYDRCEACSWQGVRGHFSMWPNPQRPMLCLEAN